MSFVSCALRIYIRLVGKEKAWKETREGARPFGEEKEGGKGGKQPESIV